MLFRLEIRERTTSLTRFFNMQLDQDGRMRCQIKPTGTVTGRLSTAQTSYGTGANMQNLNPAFGECVLSDEGMIFVEPDLSQAEKRLVALEIGDDEDLADFKAGVDIHTKQAAIALRKKVEDVTKEERNKVGKRLNHATSYNIGAESYSRQVGCSVKEGKRQLEAYHQQHPKLRQHFGEIDKHLKRSFTLRNFFGRPRRFMGEPNPRSAYDFCPQSTVGEIINRAIVYLYQNAPSDLLLLQNIHDSVLAEVSAKVDRIDQACSWMHYALHYDFSYAGRSIDVPVEFKLGWQWSKRRMVEFDWLPSMNENARRTSIETALKETRRGSRPDLSS